MNDHLDEVKSVCVTEGGSMVWELVSLSVDGGR